jgi:hypothetical protein
VAVAASVFPQLAQLWHSGSNRGLAGGRGNPGVIGSDPGLEIEISRLAFDKWVHPDDDPIEALADATEEINGAPRPDVSEQGTRAPKEDAGPGDGRVEIASGPGLGDGPIFDIPLDLPEPAQP